MLHRQLVSRMVALLCQAITGHSSSVLTTRKWRTSRVIITFTSPQTILGRFSSRHPVTLPKWQLSSWKTTGSQARMISLKLSPRLALAWNGSGICSSDFENSVLKKTGMLLAHARLLPSHRQLHSLVYLDLFKVRNHSLGVFLCMV